MHYFVCMCVCVYVCVCVCVCVRMCVCVYVGICTQHMCQNTQAKSLGSTYIQTDTYTHTKHIRSIFKGFGLLNNV